jgi:hypothetical protein
MRAPRYLLLTGLIATVALAGCSDSPSSDSSSSAGSQNKAAAPEAGVAQDQPQAAGGTAKDQTAKSPDLGVDQRSIIYTGSITVRVKDINIAATQAAAAATGAGGFVGGDERHSARSSSGTDNASVILRVPAERFNAVVQQLAGLGEEEQRQTGTEDVTEQTVDLGARIKVQQARVDSGRKLLAQAKTLNDLVMLEKEVATRESDLASLQAKQRKLADLTALSTITVSFLTPDAVVVPEDDSPPGFLAGLSAGWHSLLASLKVLLTVLGALLPWVIALALPVWGLIYLWRRFNLSRRLGPPALAPAAAPAPAVKEPAATE